MILDTCALLWLAQGGVQLSGSVKRRINKEPVVFVSAISGFEVGIKLRKGKLELPATAMDWFLAVVEHHDLRILPIDLETCIRSTELPAIHTDPCDRMIIAAARIRQLPVVTADPIFAQYGITVIR